MGGPPYPPHSPNEPPWFNVEENVKTEDDISFSSRTQKTVLFVA